MVKVKVGAPQVPVLLVVVLAILCNQNIHEQENLAQSAPMFTVTNPSQKQDKEGEQTMINENLQLTVDSKTDPFIKHIVKGKMIQVKYRHYSYVGASGLPV